MKHVCFNEMEQEKLLKTMKSLLMVLSKEPEERSWNAIHKMYVSFSISLNIDLEDLLESIANDYIFLLESFEKDLSEEK